MANINSVCESNYWGLNQDRCTFKQCVFTMIFGAHLLVLEVIM